MNDFNIFCFWFGDPMNDSRLSRFNTIKTHSNCNVTLVTENNLKLYESSDLPIHKGFDYLSATHKSDYLRAYFMYIHGGGYTDIKYCSYSWVPYFENLEKSDKDFIGYREINGGVAFNDKNSHIQHHYSELAGMCHFIFKKNTEIAKTWLMLVNEKMDEIYDELVKHPGHRHPRTVYGAIFGELFDESIKYPLGWNDLLGQILHNLMYENRGKFLLEMPLP
jgi:hypothetical protein